MTGTIVYSARTHAIVLGDNGLEYYVKKPAPCIKGDRVSFEIDNAETRIVSATVKLLDCKL